ncbi:rhodanese-like domain-containing protein [Oryzibacter oryziterrae]|uniref:rhodanese-like domain-containing protein n=1 Tax=Oryzibacter oryziterrae TaxID=2766474 RepID=UPI001F2AF7D5|nr:rhodanese-like domain-containing protein [Oryzibacter oryziterrae]
MRPLLLAAFLLAATPALAVDHLDPAVVDAAVSAGQTVLIDIRTPEEWADTGLARGATPLDMTSASFLTDLKQVIDSNPGKKLTFICRSGHSSGMLTDQLEHAGLPGLADVKGGMNAWVQESLPMESP